MSNKWEPIATAPRDGTFVLVYGEFAGEINGPYETPSCGVAVWAETGGDYPGYDWQATNTDAYGGWYRPTHWMPLPEPPQ